MTWSHPRGTNLSKEGETSLDVAAYAAHIAGAAGIAHHQGEAAQRDRIGAGRSAKVYDAQTRQRVRR